MSQAVIIKSSKNGITLVLDQELAFSELLEEILNKFIQSEKFFANSAFAISFEGRELSAEEKYRIVDTIVSNTAVKIICIIESDELRDSLVQHRIEAQQHAENKTRKVSGSFYYGSLIPGEKLETDESIVIIGDVPAGAGVVSNADVVVLGALKGTVYAGLSGRPDSFIAALEFAPENYNIAGIYGAPAAREKSGIFSKRNKTPQAKIAVACDGIINIRPLHEGLDNYL